VCALAALLLPLMAGCGPTTAKVSGQVLYQKKPVPGGILTFIPVDAPTHRANATLDEEGRYELTIQVGKCKIIVDNRELQPFSPGAPIKPPPGLNLPPGVKIDSSPKPPARQTPGKYLPIPMRYYDQDMTDLEYEVKPGPQTHDITLNEGPIRREF
jgi:hypothetical protein